MQLDMLYRMLRSLQYKSVDDNVEYQQQPGCTSQLGTGVAFTGAAALHAAGH